MSTERKAPVRCAVYTQALGFAESNLASFAPVSWHRSLTSPGVMPGRQGSRSHFISGHFRLKNAEYRVVIPLQGQGLAR